MFYYWINTQFNASGLEFTDLNDVTKSFIYFAWLHIFINAANIYDRGELIKSNM